MGEAIRPHGRRGSGPGPSPEPRGRFWVLPIVGMGCILIFIMVTMLREPVPGTNLTEAPAQVVGRWVTSDPRYSGRGLRVGAHDIVLEVGEGEPVLRGDITVMTIRQERDASVVYIEYDTGDGPVVMEMILEGNDRMHLRNQADVVWTRVR